MIEIFCEVTEEQAKQIDSDSANKVIKILVDLLSVEQPLVESFKLGGINFGWIPKLDNLSFGEFLDLNNNIDNWENMVTAMAVLYRPVTGRAADGKYLIEKYKGDKYHEILKEMPLSVVLGATVFFWNLGLDLVTSTLCSLEEEMSKMSTRQRASFQESGDGLLLSLNSLKMTLQELKRLPN
ncbi:MAG: hypothetical protein ACOVK2_05540 [Candidatus Fonsibacter sp.]